MRTKHVYRVIKISVVMLLHSPYCINLYSHAYINIYSLHPWEISHLLLEEWNKYIIITIQHVLESIVVLCMYRDGLEKGSPIQLYFNPC